MTFASRESSRNLGRPFHLYRFQVGPNAADVLRYTNVATPMSMVEGGIERTYMPLPITHGDVVAAGNLDRSSLTVTSPDDSPLADIYAGEPPSYVVTLIIYQGHVADMDFKVAWAGRVLGGTFNDSERQLDLECEPIVGSLRRNGLTRDYQYSCPLVLYGPQCRANKAAATYNVTVSAVAGPLVTASLTPVGSEERRDALEGGYAEWTNAAGRTERRSIILRDGNMLQLGSFPNDLDVGDTLTVVLGCAHIMDACRNIHNNILNYGGQPEIPLKNPIGITNNYY